MSLDIVVILVFLLWYISCAVKSIKKFVKVARCCMDLRRIRELPCPPIRLKNKKTYPYRFGIIEREAEVLEIVNGMSTSIT